MVALKEFFKSRLTKLKKEGSFTQGFSWMFSGTSLAFLIQLVFSPIISRIFGPEAYGEFAIYNLITSNLISISTLAYLQGLIIKNQPKHYFSLSLLIIGLSLISVTFFCLIYFLFSDYWNSLFDLNTGMVVIISFATILSVLNDVFSKWNLVINKFKRNTVVNISITSISKIYTIGFGKYFSPSGLGLISAELLKLFLISIVIFKTSTYKSILRKLSTLNREEISQSYNKAKELKNYPFFIWPGNWLNMFSNQLPVIFFTMYFSMGELGAFTFASSMIAIPNRLIGNAVRPIYYKKSQDILQENGDLRAFTNKIIITLFLISIPAFILLFFFGSDVFVFIFGKEWELSGNIASYLSIIYVMAFSASPIGSIFLSLKKERQLLFYQFILFGLRLGTLYVCFHFNIDILKSVLYYSMSNVIGYIILHLLIQYNLNTFHSRIK